MTNTTTATGKDPARAELLARQAADLTAQRRAEALENIARDGFPRMCGQIMDGLRRDGLVREQPGRVPYALTVAGVDAILANRAARREAEGC